MFKYWTVDVIHTIIISRVLVVTKNITFYISVNGNGLEWNIMWVIMIIKRFIVFKTTDQP